MAASIHRYPRVEKSAGFWGKRNIPRHFRGMSDIPGGWGGIRTPGRVAPSAVFKTVAFDRSATHPKLFHFAAGLSNLRFCSHRAAGSPFVRAGRRSACLADSYARPSLLPRSATHPKLFRHTVPWCAVRWQYNLMWPGWQVFSFAH